ncbi:MAG: hypothetical protein HYW48_04665 [Deltaproteobacteria bacterium]|nr:hypothetical protein [Deltaproteobacteria bacterium]
MPISRRTQILIEPYQQLRFGLIFILINIVFAALMCSVFGYFLWDIYEAISEYFKLDPSQKTMAAEKFIRPLLMGLGVVALFVATTLFTSARYTHQIYGPLVSIRRFLDELLSGQKPNPIRLRKTDQLHDIADRLNNIAGLIGPPKWEDSKDKIVRFLNDLIEGKEVKALRLSESDPLKAIADKLNKLSKS